MSGVCAAGLSSGGLVTNRACVISKYVDDATYIFIRRESARVASYKRASDGDESVSVRYGSKTDISGCDPNNSPSIFFAHMRINTLRWLFASLGFLALRNPVCHWPSRKCINANSMTSLYSYMYLRVPEVLNVHRRNENKHLWTFFVQFVVKKNQLRGKKIWKWNFYSSGVNYIVKKSVKLMCRVTSGKFPKLICYNFWMSAGKK